MDSGEYADVGGVKCPFAVFQHRQTKYPMDIVTVMVKTSRHFKDLSPKIQSRKDHVSYQGQVATICVGQLDASQPRKLSQVQISEATVVDVNDYGKMYGYNTIGTLTGYEARAKAMTVVGDCGSTWVLSNKSVQRPIIAIHSAADSHSCFGTPLIIEDILEACEGYNADGEKKAQSYPKVKGVTILPYQRVMDIDEEDPLVKTLETMKPGCVIGMTERKLNDQSKTRLWRSPLNVEGVNIGIPDAKEPAVLTANDKRLPPDWDGDIYWDQALKWFVPDVDPTREFVTDQDVDDFMDTLGDYLGNKMKRAGLQTKVATLREALNGISDHAYSNPIHRATSAGYPWQLDFTNGKMDALQFDECSQIWDVRHEGKGLRLRKAIDTLESAILEQKKTASVFVCRQKDELRPVKRVREEPKTRTFAAGSLDLNIVCRKYLGSVSSRVKELSGTPMTLGDDPLSLDWHRRELQLRSMGSEGYDADVKDYDSRVRTRFLKRHYRIYDKIAQITDPKWKKSHRRMRKGIYRHLSKPLIVLAGRIIAMANAHVSGKFGTTEDNDFEHIFYLTLIWNILAAENGFPVGFYALLEWVAFVLRGDDDKVVPHPKVKKWFNFRSYQAQMWRVFRIQVTPGDKYAVAYDVHPIDDLMFVQRTTVLVDGYYRAKLAIESFDKMLNWTRVEVARRPDENMTTILFDITTIEQTVDSILIEATMYGKRFFNTVRNHLLERLYRIGSTKSLPDWDRYRQDVNPPLPASYNGESTQTQPILTSDDGISNRSREYARRGDQSEDIECSSDY